MNRHRGGADAAGRARSCWARSPGRCAVPVPPHVPPSPPRCGWATSATAARSECAPGAGRAGVSGLVIHARTKMQATSRPPTGTKIAQLKEGAERLPGGGQRRDLDGGRRPPGRAESGCADPDAGPGPGHPVGLAPGHPASGRAGAGRCGPGPGRRPRVVMGRHAAAAASLWWKGAEAPCGGRAPFRPPKVALLPAHPLRQKRLSGMRGCAPSPTIRPLAHALWAVCRLTSMPGPPSQASPHVLLGPRVSKTSWPSTEPGRRPLASGPGSLVASPLRACDLRLLSGKIRAQSGSPVSTMSSTCQSSGGSMPDSRKSSWELTVTDPHLVRAIHGTPRQSPHCLGHGVAGGSGSELAPWYALVRMLKPVPVTEQQSATQPAPAPLRPRRPSPGSLWSRPAAPSAKAGRETEHDAAPAPVNGRQQWRRRFLGGRPSRRL